MSRASQSKQWSPSYSNLEATAAFHDQETYPHYTPPGSNQKPWGMSVTTNTLVWALNAVGLSSITEANAAEVYGRIAVHERVNGTSMYTNVDGSPLAVTPKMVFDHIGLTTTVPNKPRPDWMKVVAREVDIASTFYLTEMGVLV